MSVTLFSQTADGALVKLLQFDATMKEGHEFEAVATEHPVETGLDAVDGVRPKPISLTLEAIITNVPLRGGPPPQGFAPGGAPNVERALAQLRGVEASGQLLTVGGRFGNYENMVLLKISLQVDKSTSSDALVVSLTFREVRIVKSATVKLRVSIPRAKGKTDNGHKPSTPAKQSESLLHSIPTFF